MSPKKKPAPLWKTFARIAVFGYLPLAAVSIATLFPYDTDPSIGKPRSKGVENGAQGFYDAAYSAKTDEPETKYVEFEKKFGEALGVQIIVQDFVKQYNLKDKKVLEVGSGTGSLQNLVDDYTGLDITPSLARRYKKKFVVGSATEMPFPDNSFDAIWSVWVLEHIPEPERALAEMRRVLKPGGLLFLAPAWNCEPYAAHGYNIRPYSAFGLEGKWMKATIPTRRIARYYTQIPIRFIRQMQYKIGGSETRLHFTFLEPNYKDYWEPDSDAVVAIDSHEAALWHQSRGDACLTCKGLQDEPGPVILRIQKPAAAAQAAQAEQPAAR